MFPRRRLLRERHGARARADFNLAAPLAVHVTATDMRSTDTSAQLDLFSEPPRSGAVSRLIDRPHADLRPGDVTVAIDRSTRPTPSMPGTRTSPTATRTTGTSRTRTGRERSADRSGAGLSFHDLLDAWLDCRRTKRNTPAARAFEENLEENLQTLYEALVTGTYTPGPSICFVVLRPRPREVWAASFADRVVHHLLHAKIARRFERAFIADTCACIEGRGTLYAARRLEAKVRSITQNWTRSAYYLKCDIASFFPSVDRERLVDQLAERIREPFWRDVARRIVLHDPRPSVEVRGDPARLARIRPEKSLFNQDATHGLPIGNLPSQFGANVYLDALDQFVKHRLRVRHYVRYVDDFVLLHESPQQLNAWRAAIELFLQERLGLRLNPSKTILQPITRGIDFAGHVVKPWRREIRRRTVRAGLHRAATMPAPALTRAANSYFGLFRQATRSHHDRARLANLVRRRGHAVDHRLTKAYT